MPNSDSLQRVFPPAPVISNVALRLSRVSRLGTSAYKPILAFLISLRSAGSTTDRLCYHPSLSLIPAYPRLLACAIPLYFSSSCLYLYPVTSIQIMTAQRGRLEVYGLILSHLRIFATSHADLSLRSYHLLLFFPLLNRHVLTTRSGDSLGIPYHLGLTHLCSNTQPQVQVNRKRIVIGILFATLVTLLRDGSFINPLSRLVGTLRPS